MKGSSLSPAPRQFDGVRGSVTSMMWPRKMVGEAFHLFARRALRLDLDEQHLAFDVRAFGKGPPV